MKDNFSAQSSKYAKFRPTYPKELYDFLITLVHQPNTAWDCATGNGQVAVELAKQFAEVYATDISNQQLKEAPERSNIHYKIESAEQTDFENSKFDLITIAQAIHWLDFNAFFPEVNRVLKPNGIFAAFGYDLMKVSPEIDTLIYYLYEDILGPYWDVERKHIENGYLAIPFPFQEIKSPALSISTNWNFDELIGYLETWSALQHYLRKNNKNPIDFVYNDLKIAWGDNQLRAIHFNLILKVFKR